MTGPIVLISHFAIKEGGLEAYRELQRNATAALLAAKPRTLAFLVYLDEERTQMNVVHLFADAESMDLHFDGSGERAKAAYEVVEPRGWEIYGSPSNAALETMHQAAASAGVPLSVQPFYEAGFLRLHEA